VKIQSLFVTLACAAITAGCATSTAAPPAPPAPPPAPTPMNVSETRELSAVVTKIDVPKRKLTLRGEAGNEVTIDVDPAVRNLPQVKVGDKVVARYYEGLVADLRKPTDPASPAVEVADAIAQPGQRPAAAVGTRLTIPVTITAVDTSTNVVSFYGESREVRSLAVVRPEAKAFIKQLKPGDQVVLTYTEALAVSVEPVR
jgi:hypothetical protein